MKVNYNPKRELTGPEHDLRQAILDAVRNEFPLEKRIELQKATNEAFANRYEPKVEGQRSFVDVECDLLEWDFQCHEALIQAGYMAGLRVGARMMSRRIGELLSDPTETKVAMLALHAALGDDDRLDRMLKGLAERMLPEPPEEDE